MSESEAQARWRSKTDKRRVEIYLPVAAADRLDVLAAKSGQSRAAVITRLLAAPVSAPPLEPGTAASVSTPTLVGALAFAPSLEVTERRATGSFRFRRPDRADHDEVARNWDWIAEYEGGLRIGLRHRPHEFYSWYGAMIDGVILFPKDAKAKTRTEVVDAIRRLYLP